MLPPATRRMLSALALVGLGIFVVLVLLLHVLEPDVAGLDHTMSEFALGKFGALMVIAFFAAGLGSISLAIALWQGDRRAPVAAAFLGLWGFGLLVSGLVPTDPYGTTDATATTAGNVHNLVGGVSFLCCGVGLILLGVRARKWDAWSTRGATILATGILGLLAVVTLFLPIQIPEGALQRVMVAFFLLGLVLAASWLRAAPADAATAAPAPQKA